MKIIISPAKKMREDGDGLPWQGLPRFHTRAEELLQLLRQMSYQELKKLWKCSDQIAEQNVARLERVDLYRPMTPALLAYEGIQYQHMAPGVFSVQEWDYVQDHLRILSGLYGLLRPLDGVVPYRLEMQAKLRTGDGKDLYEYWGDSLAKALMEEDSCILNLASKEYSRSISRYLPASIKFVTCIFGEVHEGKVVEKGTMCKMARGEMVRFLAEHQADSLEEVKCFDRLNHRFDPKRSDDNTFVFVRDTSANKKCGQELGFAP